MPGGGQSFVSKDTFEFPLVDGSRGCVKSSLGVVPLLEKGAGRRPAEHPSRKPCGTGGTSRNDFLHNLAE